MAGVGGILSWSPVAGWALERGGIAGCRVRARAVALAQIEFCHVSVPPASVATPGVFAFVACQAVPATSLC